MGVSNLQKGNIVRQMLTGALLILLSAVSLFGQADRGTITGIVTDPSGSVVPKAKITAKNAQTGDSITAESTETGNYTLASVPIGAWTVTVEMAGFKKFVAEQTRVAGTQTVRIDAALQIGNVGDSVVVQAEAVVLQTESAEQSTTVAEDLIRELPINWANTFYGNQAVRNPLSIMQIMPGVGGGTSTFGFSGQSSGGASLNGAPPGSYKILLEGQDSTPLFNPGVSFANQSSVEALQEFTLQASNYAAEFGQAQGGIFSFTTKSGTNQFHGGAFYRLTNEALNAHLAYTGLRPASRQNNYGGTFGGPIWIPKVYDGHNRTFFFFSYEGFRSVSPVPTAGTYVTVPGALDRAGNFQAVLGPRLTCPNSATPCVDALGNPVFAGQIYDPKAIGSDGVTRLAFANNIIPANRLDPVALKIQSYFPTPTTGDRVNNYLVSKSVPRPQLIPSLKIDHNLTSSLKLSGYAQGQVANSSTTPDGFPDVISSERKMPTYSHTERVNVDYTLSPNMLLHLGSGYVWWNIGDISVSVDNFDSLATLGLRGAIGPGFPRITGIGNTSANVQVGGFPAGAGAQFNSSNTNTVFTNAASLNWVNKSHTYKFGGSWNNRGFFYTSYAGGWGSYGFGAAQTGQPAVTATNGSPGLGYASFLLGAPTSATITPNSSVNWHQVELGLYAQDTWKVRRNLTIDYGLRYDRLVPPYEDRNRITSFSPTVANPSAGNLPGGVIYQGYGPGTCECKNFYSTYNLAFGPRFGVSYQINQKTVLRAGWGFFFGTPVTGTNGPGNGAGTGTGYDQVSFTGNNGASALPSGLQGGLVYDTSLFRGQFHSPGAAPTISPATGLSSLNTPSIFDSNNGRPPRTSQINLSVQRQIAAGLNIDVAYVGNRGAWLSAAFNPLNDVTPDILAARGLSLSNSANRTLLTSALSTSGVQTAGFKAPFATYPTSSTLASSLRPFPQFSGNLSPVSAVGSSWYDSLQIKSNIRLKHGITGLVTYTWSKSLTRTALSNDNKAYKQISGNTVPQALQVSLAYQTPHLTRTQFLGGNLVVRQVLSDWQISTVVRYQSGQLITAPTSNNNLANYLPGVATQYLARVPGESLYLTDINGNIDPTRQLMLNPKAWTECGPVGTFSCGASNYMDFRQRRVPTEQFSVGRRIQLGEKQSRYFEVRFDIINPFNRLVFPNAGVGSILTQPAFNGAGALTGGFGFMNVNNIDPGSPRNMLIVARIAF